MFETFDRSPRPIAAALALKPAASGAGMTALGRMLPFAVLLSAAPLARAAEGYPDLLVRALGLDCLALNRGERLFGEWDPSVKANRFFDVCHATGRAFGDINGDGRLDQVDESGVRIGHGDGRFGIRTTAFVNHNTAGIAFACGDLNHDGRDDVVMGTVGVRFFLGNADGTLTPIDGVQVPTYVAGGRPPELRLVDLDRDGELDLIGASANGPHVAFNVGDAAFVVDSSGVEGTSWTRVHDMNSDGLQDIVSFGVTTETPRNLLVVEVFLTTKERTFVPPHALRIPGMADYPEGYPQGVTTADVTGDSKPDILIGGAGAGKLTLFAGKGDGTFEDPRTIDLPVADAPRAVLLYDLDLDGLLDLAVGYRGAGTRIYWGLKDGFVDFTRSTDLGGPAPTQLDVVTGLHRTFVRGDVDEDGKVDLTDALAVCEQLFQGRPMVCGDASDADDSGLVDLADAVHLVRFLFLQGPPPPHPYPKPGGDRASDSGHFFRQGIGVDIGCSYETFYGPWFGPCAADDDPSRCVNPILQFIDVCAPELDCPPR